MVCVHDLGIAVEHIPGLPDLTLFWVNDVSVVRVFRCGLTRVMFLGKNVLALIFMIMTGGLSKIVSKLGGSYTSPTPCLDLRLNMMANVTVQYAASR